MGGLTQSQELALQVLGTAALVVSIGMLLRIRRFYAWLTGMPKADGDQRHPPSRGALATLDRACDKVATGLQYALIATIVGWPLVMLIMFTEPSEGKKGWLNLIWTLLVPAVLATGIYLLWRYLPEGSGGGGGGDDVCWDNRGGPYRC